MCSVLFSTFLDSSRPQIITDPQSQTAITGESVRLSCAVKNGSINGLQILWKKNNVDMNEAKVTKLTQVCAITCRISILLLQ